MIKIENLKHYYTDADGNEVKALDGVTLEIKQGEFVAVIGANGSGKSTLARHLNCLLLPTSGRVEVGGKDTLDEKHMWYIRQQVGMVFQNPDNQIVAAIVEEDVAFGPENIGVAGPEIAPRVAKALAAVGMTDYARHAPHLLSGGQKQRVAIAGIMALEPKCIVLDEPTAMLDPQGRKEIVSTVRRLNKEKGITIVYITHYMTEALAADRVVVMEKGHIRFTGTPREVFSRVDELEQLGLEAPLAAKVASELRKSGVKLSENIITDEELAQALCQLH
ncbi:MAG: energy-coupling factor transporter ATPase [Phascolarctobacterium sp.]|uniref:energy-coupling factor transporter ATPase n=1 Tax=Phascolarctobacterium sp. TaxID=2049039 RepID=UPI0026DBE7F7|nr:energy-coupling factor transporter ATPase [Phascolarctobacterium sp.]MDO4921894.1 energy-coupling factor transporter ATPase [Phascolarctobacterium sp.]